VLKKSWRCKRNPQIFTKPGPIKMSQNESFPFKKNTKGLFPTPSNASFVPPIIF